MERRLGLRFAIVYGQTETSPLITTTRPDDVAADKAETIGPPLPQTEVKIVDPASGEEVPTGSRGELWARGYVVMKGYYHMPEQTAAAITNDGWLRSGDEASIDADGNVRITGRIKDLIIRGGENVAPKEIEDVIRQHPAVSDVSVYAVTSEFFGEEVAAAIRPQAGATIDAADIAEFCKARLARFKVPRFIKSVETFPMTASGKIQKYRLREQHEAELRSAGPTAAPPRPAASR
jgi:fatty-acyl-CoA synthase